MFVFPHSSAGLASPVIPAGESTLHVEGDGSPISLDVEEVHRIFKLGDMDVAGFVDGLSAAADNGRVSWVAFLRYMCDLADVRLLRAGRREAVSVAGKMFNLFDEEKQQEVELRVLASGLSVRSRVGLARFAVDTCVPEKRVPGMRQGKYIRHGPTQ